MFNGAQNTGGGGRRLFTGLHPVQLIKANPTLKEFNKLTGFERERDFNYDIVELGETKYRPIEFLVYSEETGFNTLRILFSLDNVTNRDGNKFVFVDSLGQFTYYALNKEDVLNNPKVTWHTDDMRNATKGEEALFILLQSLIRYNPKSEGAAWMKDLTNAGYKPEAIFKQGDMSCLNDIIDYANSHGNKVVVPFCVRETDSGNYQDILTARNCFYWDVPDLSSAEERFANELADMTPNRICGVKFQQFNPAAPEEAMAKAEEETETSMFGV